MKYPTVKKQDGLIDNMESVFLDSFICRMTVFTSSIIKEELTVQTTKEKKALLHQFLSITFHDDKNGPMEMIKPSGFPKARKAINTFFALADSLGVLDQILKEGKPYLNQ